MAADAGREADVLAALEERLAALDDAPLDGHPQVLEDVHRALVAELDGLAGASSGAPARVPPAG